MSRIIFTPAALNDLQRLGQFLRAKNKAAAKRVSMAITKTIPLLAQHPKIGRSIEIMGANYREVLIEFGNSGYVLLYRYEQEVITILAIRHQKEAGY